jgi:c-di-GMP-related signal transduction protein
VLRYVNSAAFALNHPVRSINQALVVLGDQRIRKLIALAVMAGLVSNHPPELVWISLARARLCESIARQSRLSDREQDGFLMGLFSLLDVMIGRPLADLFQELGMPVDMLAAITGDPSSTNIFSRIYRLCLACEAGDMPEIESHAEALGLTPEMVSELTVDAMTWSELLCRESGVRH